jgi:predicted RNA-binding protein with PUA-like domain
MPPTPPKHWLFKTEPSTYSFAQLLRDGKTNWNGVRNFQARNFLKGATVGDLALIYHSGDEKAVVGIARVTRAAYPDPDPKKPGEWVQLDLACVEPLRRAVPLKEIKSIAALAELPLIKQSRLSCMPVTGRHFDTLVKLGKSAP